MIEIKDKSAVIKRVLIDFLIFTLLLASDLISKDIVMNRLGLESYSSYVLIDGIFAIYPCFNDGASFSFMSGKTGFLIALTVIMLVALCAIIILNAIKKPKTSWLFRWSMVLLISGGLGNLVDRIFCDGEVRDFIQYLFLDGIFEKLFNSSFGIGNVADIYLVLGVFLICAYIIFDYKEGDLGIFKFKKAEVVKDENMADTSSSNTQESNGIDAESKPSDSQDIAPKNGDNKEKELDISSDKDKIDGVEQ